MKNNAKKTEANSPLDKIESDKLIEDLRDAYSSIGCLKESLRHKKIAMEIARKIKRDLKEK